MKNLLAFVKLDFMSIKAYFTVKNLILIMFLSAWLSYTSDSSMIIIAIIMMFAYTYSNYPFMVGEKNGIDALYSTLPITRKSIVVGRYIFMLILDMFAIIFSCAISCLVQTIMRRELDIKEMIMTALLILAAYVLCQIIQAPIYFKVGYGKAKFLGYLPIIGFYAIVLSFNFFFKNKVTSLMEIITANQALMTVLLVVLIAVLIYLSCKLSMRFYKKRNF